MTKTSEPRGYPCPPAALFGVARACSVAVCAVVVALGGCAQPSDAPAAFDASTSAAVERDVEVIEAYVDAMSQGDIDAALEQRCDASRVQPEKRETFEGDLSRLTETAGQLGLDQVKLEDADPAVAGDLAGRNPTAWRYWLTLDRVVVEEPLVGIVVDDGDERRLCAIVTPHLQDMQRDLGNDLVELGQPARPALSDLMPASPGSDYRQISDQAVSATDLADFPPALAAAAESWGRQWQKGSYGGVTVSATRYPSADDALAAAADWMRRFGADAVETFAVPGVEGASGVRVTGYAWLWVQPPGVGPYLDEVGMVFGDTHVTVAVCCSEAGATTDVAMTTAQQVAEAARG